MDELITEIKFDKDKDRYIVKMTVKGFIFPLTNLVAWVTVKGDKLRSIQINKHMTMVRYNHSYGSLASREDFDKHHFINVMVDVIKRHIKAEMCYQTLEYWYAAKKVQFQSDTNAYNSNKRYP